MAASALPGASFEERLDWDIEGAQHSFSHGESSFLESVGVADVFSPLASPRAPYALCFDRFPWADLEEACRGCEAHLAVLDSLRSRGFPAALLLPSASSPFFLLNFASLHSLTLFAAGIHPKQRKSREGRSLRGDRESAWGVDSVPEERRREDRMRARPREVLYLWTDDEDEPDARGDAEERRRNARRVRIHWAVVDFVVEKINRSLPSFFSIARPLPPPGVLMEAALLAWRRKERSSREEDARRKLMRWRERKIFVHSAMTDVHDFSFDTTKQRFQTTPLKPLTLASLGRLFCDSSVFASTYDRRYFVLQQRCLLHPLLSLHGREASGRQASFALSGLTDGDKPDREIRRVIFEVDGVTRRPGQRQLLLGILGRDVNKDLALQGLFSDIRIKFEKEFRPRPGFFLEGHVVLADGFFAKHDDCFHILDLSHPPRWPSSDRLILGRRAAAVRAVSDHKKRRTGACSAFGESVGGGFARGLEEEEPEGLIARQQASSMFGGLLELNEMEALEAWREVEEEREEDQDDEDELRELLPLLLPGCSLGAAQNALGEAEGGQSEKENRTGAPERKKKAEGKRSATALRIEPQDPDAPDPMAWVIITECHFNEPGDLDLLGAMLATFESQGEYPSGFVFLGSFSSSFSGGEDVYSAGFGALFNLLTSRFPLFVARCHLVFVPGPEDPSFARESLPRLPLTPPFTSDFQQRLERAIPACKGKVFFTTSPCRIRHFTSSMLFFRHDVFKALSRDALFTGGRNKETEGPTSVDTDIVDLLYNTVVGQAHLCPITADHRLIKHRDQSLGLFPMPDLVFLCDKSAPPVTKKDPKSPDEFIFANANASFRETKSFFIYEMTTHQLTKYFVPSSRLTK
uniref:DNA polymerase II subunit 2 n=1 Tax=Neospora caninum (strain Liverpool) TaxID=572307 RepID=A0A0F7UBX6_NEOCL|nr:TPA: DNA polymerase epsilon subunit B [Neospora caninum Liverpool]